MTVEEAGQIRYIKLEIQRLQEELKELQDSRTFYKSVILSDVPKGRGQYRNKCDDYLYKEKQLKDMLAYSLKKLVHELEKFEEMLRNIDDAELRVILRMRCIDGMDWEDIGDDIGMDRTTASRKFRLYFKSLLPG